MNLRALEVLVDNVIGGQNGMDLLTDDKLYPILAPIKTNLGEGGWQIHGGSVLQALKDFGSKGWDAEAVIREWEKAGISNPSLVLGYVGRLRAMVEPDGYQPLE